MNIRAVFKLISYILTVIGLGMAVCWAAALHYGDPPDAANAFRLAAAMTLVMAGVLWLLTRGPVDLSWRDGIAVVTLGWLVVPAFGAGPFLFSGVLHNPVDAVFETVSGFTTCGASVFADVESLPKSVLLWRAFTHFFGGMGILVLCVAILPLLGVGGMQIYRAEVAGPTKDRLTPRIANTAKLLWSVYVLLCLIETLLLRLGGMSWLDSACHAVATIATGGFSTRNSSIGAYDSLYIEIVVVVFMMLGATNFVLFYRALRGDVLCFWRDPEFRFFIGLWLVMIGVVTLNTRHQVYPTFGEAFRNSVFSVTTIVSTTGFATADFALWPTLSKALLVCVVLVGACAGSTGGAMKQIRFMVAIKAVLREIRLFMHPQAVVHVKLGKEPVEHATVASICAFVLLYLLTFTILTLVMVCFVPDFETAASAVAANMACCGPGLSAVGPMSNYGGLPDSGKIVLMLAMLLGRLEFYTMLALLFPSFWKR